MYRTLPEMRPRNHRVTRLHAYTRVLPNPEKIFFILQRNVDKRIIWNVFISCTPHKKRTKEGGWGEALTAKSFGTALRY